MAMGSGHPVGRDAVGDARMVFLVALSLKQARCALTWLQHHRRFSTTSGLAGCAAVPRSTSAALLFAIVLGLNVHALVNNITLETSTMYILAVLVGGLFGLAERPRPASDGVTALVHATA